MKKVFLLFFISCLLIFTPHIYANGKKSSYQSGQYIIGQNMPAGEYQLHLENNNLSGFFKRTKTWFDGEIIQIKDFENGFYYATFFEGEYITLQNIYAIPQDESAIISHQTNLYPSSMYKVGKDISPGAYKIIPNDSQNIATMAIFTNSSYYNINNFQYINQEGLIIHINEGDYLELKHCSATKKTSTSDKPSTELKEYKLKEIRYSYNFIQQELSIKNPNNSLENELWKQELLYNANRLVYLTSLIHNQYNAQQTKLLYDNAVELRIFIRGSIESKNFPTNLPHLFITIPAWINSIDNPNPKLDPLP